MNKKTLKTSRLPNDVQMVLNRTSLKGRSTFDINKDSEKFRRKKQDLSYMNKV